MSIAPARERSFFHDSGTHYKPLPKYNHNVNLKCKQLIRDAPLRRRTASVVASAPVSSQRGAGTTRPPLLIDRTFISNWRTPLEGHSHPDPAKRPIIALGKFDALHKGHQALAAAALALGGSPVLLSFSGMGAVLGWQPRKPLVAPCDRPRVLDLWAQQLSQQQQQQQQGVSASCNSTSEPLAINHPQQQQQADGVVPIRQHYIPFAAIRSMSPEAFVELLTKQLGAAGVVAGVNYRFGYHAAGDSALLQQLCAASNLPVSIVELVGAAEPGAVGVVSSSKIREMLSVCRIEAARKSLGRPYRLVAAVQLPQQQQQQSAPEALKVLQKQHNTGSSSSNSHVFVRQADFLNQHPGPGIYLCDMQLYIGASPHDDLLQLQRAVAAFSSNGSTSSSSSSNSSAAVQVLQGLQASGSRCTAAVRGAQQQVEVSDNGLSLPQEFAAAAAAAAVCSSSSSSSSSRNSSIAGSSGQHSQQLQCALEASIDPRCWDTDDNDDSADELEGVSALLVIDFERCLRQICTVDSSSSSSSSGGGSSSSSKSAAAQSKL